MSEEDLAEDSTGATEAETDSTEAVSEDTVDSTSESDSVAESDEGSDGLDTVYEIGEIQATEAEITSWREAHNTKQSFDKDYTQKSQKNAEKTKALDAKHDQLDQEIAFYESLAPELEDMLMGELSKVDLAELIEEDPSQYERTKQRIESVKRWKSDFQEKVNAKREEVIKREQESLYKDMGWYGEGGQEKFEAEGKAIYDQAKKEGANDQDWSKVTSGWVMKALLKAHKFDDLMAKKPAIAKQVRKAPVAAKPSSSSAAPKTLAERMYPNMTK